jgi:hypothetical protein
MRSRENIEASVISFGKGGDTEIFSAVDLR